jgi:hypothetical protein
MIYNEYLKQKIINLYSINQKIGKHSITDKDFDFLNKYFDVKNNINPNIYSISEILQYIISDYKNNLPNKNKIGFDFVEILSRARENADIFLQQTPLLQPQITSEQKQELEYKYTQVANKLGLKEFYYTLNPNLNSEENYDKAILLLNKTTLELEKLQEKLNIKDSYKIGNNILSIQVNWQEEPQNQGYYNYCSNTICLKDENSTFPLIHEYVHFIDKTNTCLLLTGKTSQQLYEEKLFSQIELFYNFDMSVFSKIKFKKENFPWIDVLNLKSLFKDEIKQNKYIQKIFNKFDSKKDYKKEFKEIIFDWIEEKNYPNKKLLKEDINHLLKNNSTTFNFNNRFYSKEETEILGKVLVFNTFDLNMNNSKNWAEEFDYNVIKKLYYSTQKEMLARTIEQTTQGKLEQLSDRLTTPKLSNNEQEKFFEIIKSWQNISQEIIQFQNKQNISNKIIKIRNKLEQNPEIISHLKLKI